MSALKWRVIPESIDEDTDEPTGWAAEVNSDYYGKYIWISKMDDDEFDVETNFGNPKADFKTLVTCKTLTSAKRWVAQHIR